MNQLLFTFLCVFLLFDKQEPTILNPKYPVIITVLECPQQKEIEKKVTEDLQKKQWKILSKAKAVGIYQEELRRVRERQSDASLAKLEISDEGIRAHLDELISMIPTFAQNIYIKVVSADKTIDSCYYYILEQPEPLARSIRFRKNDTKVFIQDSILKRNDVDALVSAIVQRATTKPL